jgi:hypothetical protein
MSGKIPTKQQKIVCIMSGNRCAMPDCRKVLVLDGTKNDLPAIIGRIAHIKGENPTSARYDPNMTDEEKNSCKNLILICGDCHTKIDNQPNTYTAKKLYQIKNEHENFILVSTKNEIVNVTFAELNVVNKYLISGRYTTSYKLTVIPPKDKIKKNNLSGSVETLIATGIIQVKQVANYIDQSPDIDFGERLKQGFVDKYEQLKNEENMYGDDLFNALFDFSCGGSNDFKERAAGLAVLVYFFEKCDVFEK